jgi:uncharacterized small protein (DUF1192 family)
MKWGTLALIDLRAHTDKMAMDDEDLAPRKAKPAPKNLDPMSIEELGDYIAELKAEITRVESEITKKKKVRDGAAALFRK